jgi:1-acyl-sn-glycerol-3-phosphate acyltransferase
MSPRSTSTAIASSSADLAPAPAGLRLPLLAAWTLAGFGAWAMGTLLVLPSSRGRQVVRRTVLRGWSRGVTRLLGIRITVEGAVPAAPFFLVSNHLSYLDIVVYAAGMPCRFVAKQEVRDWPVVGFLAWAVGTIFIDRTMKRDAIRVLDDLGSAVRDGDGVVVFAEATSTPGHTVLPFRPALLEWAARTGYPVHYASVEYRTPESSPPAHLAVCWWGDMTFGRHLVDLSRLPRIEATIRYGDAPIAERDRKRLAVRLQRAVAAQFTPVVTEQG